MRRGNPLIYSATVDNFCIWPRALPRCRHNYNQKVFSQGVPSFAFKKAVKICVVSCVRIVLRADSGFAREELMAWCEANGVHFLFGLAKSPALPCISPGYLPAWLRWKPVAPVVRTGSRNVSSIFMPIAPFMRTILALAAVLAVLNSPADAATQPLTPKDGENFYDCVRIRTNLGTSLKNAVIRCGRLHPNDKADWRENIG